MDFEDEIFLEDDIDILDIIDFGFPRRYYTRRNYIEDMDDCGFFRRFRLTKPTVLSVLERIEDQLEFDNDLNNSVSPIIQLLTALLFYGSCAHQIIIGDIMDMDQSTVSRVVTKMSEAICSIRNDFIKMPSPEELLECQNNFHQIAGFPRVIECIDCTHIKIRSPGGDDGEVYRNRKSYFSINVQLVCNSSLEIINIVARWPGSAQCTTIFNNSRLRTRFEAGEFGNAILLGDGGYSLKSYLLTPLANPYRRAETLYNGTMVCKRRFPTMCYGLRTKMDTTLSIIVATAVLHNVALTMNEDIPPAPEGINAEQLDYLIQQGDIPAVNLQQNINYDFRNNIVNDISEQYLPILKDIDITVTTITNFCRMSLAEMAKWPDIIYKTHLIHYAVLDK